MSAPRWCPVCKEPVTYADSGRGSWWVHTETGRAVRTIPNQHDVNSYAPHDLLTERPEQAKR
jgi:hypothetical protein